MSPPAVLLASHDTGLLQHWQHSLPDTPLLSTGAFAGVLAGNWPVGSLVWLDGVLPDLPGWADPCWKALSGRYRLIFTHSRPDQAQAKLAFEAGCMAYCHAYADSLTLQQVQEVVLAGNVWVGRELMQQMLGTVQRVPAPPSPPDWAVSLTEREREVALLAANAASNRDIALRCAITERTVKAHLAAIFHKLNVSDRLQLALRVHGIS
ncbi:response regulator transcription factor [Chitinimonas naiadis]